MATLAALGKEISPSPPGARAMRGMIPTRRTIYLSLEDVAQIIAWGTIAQIHGHRPKGDLAARLMALQRELAELPEKEYTEPEQP